MNLHKQTSTTSAAGKRVIIRADFNVPLDDSLQITDDTGSAPRFRRSTVWSTTAEKPLSAPSGPPEGRFDPKFSLAPVAKRLGRLLGKEVIFAPDCIGPAVESLVAKMKPGDVMLLENLRFHSGEEKNDEHSPNRSLRSAMSTSTMPSAPRIGRTLPRSESRSS